MYSKIKQNNQIFSTFDEIKPRNNSNKLLHPLINNKIRNSSMKSINSALCLNTLYLSIIVVSFDK